MMEIYRLVRFGLVGACATLVYIAVGIAANEIFLITPVVASILAQTVAFGISYIGHSMYSFRVETDHNIFLWRFSAIAALTFVLSTLTTWLIVDVAHLSSRIGLLAVAVLIPVVNYLFNRHWVFAHGLNPKTLVDPANQHAKFDGR